MNINENNKKDLIKIPDVEEPKIYHLIMEWEQSKEEEIDLQGFVSILDNKDRIIETPIFYGNTTSKDKSIEMDSMHFPTSYLLNIGNINRAVNKLTFFLYSNPDNPAKSKLYFEKEVKIMLLENHSSSEIYKTKINLKCELPNLIQMLSLKKNNQSWNLMQEVILFESDLIKTLFLA